MLVNPYAQKLETVGQTRLLLDTFGIIGLGVRDVSDSRRTWTIHSIYSPIKRAVGGIRTKLIDEDDFVTFINQRDLEVLLGCAKPGDRCNWSGSIYVSPESSEWVGCYMDEEDMLDDLQARELLLRYELPGVLPSGLELERRLHKEYRQDVEELWTVLWDMDPVSGYGPDLRLETIKSRWTRVEQRKVQWPIT